MNTNSGANTGTSAGSGAGDTHPAATSSSAAAPVDVGSGHISVDTGSIYRGASRIEGAGGNFEVFAAQHQQLESYRPLVKDQTDDSWNQFGPSYQQATEQFMAGVRGIGQAVRGMHDSLLQFAKFCEATEDNATAVAKHALDLNGTPPTAADGRPGQPITPADSAGHAGQSQPDTASTHSSKH
jgi:hypothetical protein